MQQRGKVFQRGPRCEHLALVTHNFLGKNEYPSGDTPMHRLLEWLQDITGHGIGGQSQRIRIVHLQGPTKQQMSRLGKTIMCWLKLWIHPRYFTFYITKVWTTSEVFEGKRRTSEGKSIALHFGGRCGMTRREWLIGRAAFQHRCLVVVDVVVVVVTTMHQVH